ncbi:DUF1259 domain-containing protein [Bacillus marinisedimentorum]|uniref:DUF1259 domain-containing protein n=1 Tax=Bacillus marinisedimentorum TaxID=1821260 RepID=UPI0008733FCA|nr:DUF1259 domain-containing protein [Bacillus marinisedimentorum]
MSDMKELCKKFGETLGGEGKAKEGVCAVEIKRNLDVKIMGKPFKSEIKGEIHFESLDEDGKSLNAAEMAVLEEEVPAYVAALSKYDLMVSAVHNHWLHAEPNLLYVHCQSVEPPLDFAEKLAEAIKVLKK